MPLFICWGSFLNVLAFRLVRSQNIVWPRSACPYCKHTISWYDNIPLISWLLLCGQCRTCKKPISWLYPAIELLTTILLTALYLYVPLNYFFAYFIFFSALIVTIRSDIETMLISRFVTIFLIPFGLLFSAFGLLPITILDSICGALLGYFFLLIMSKIFFWIKGKEGMGQGDLELLAFIGSFIGIAGCWMSLLLGSIMGSIVGLTYIVIFKAGRSAKIPFGPFLASGALIYVFLQEHLTALALYAS